MVCEVQQVVPLTVAMLQRTVDRAVLLVFSLIFNAAVVVLKRLGPTRAA